MMHRYPTCLQLLLCLVTVVDAGSFSIRHTHECGGNPHGHGLGWWNFSFRFATPVLNDQTSTFAGTRHTHLIVLGFEFFDLSDTPTDVSGDAWRRQDFRLGNLMRDDAEATADSEIDSPACVAEMAKDLANRLSDNIIERSQSIFTSPGEISLTVCDMARQERSGVLLT